MILTCGEKDAKDLVPDVEISDIRQRLMEVH
jgi:hypothetical protein